MNARGIIGGLSAIGASAALLAATAAPAPADTSNQFFVTGSNATMGATIEFWGAQWWKANTVSGGAPASFKGWGVSVTPTSACSGTFTSNPGNSSDPPPTIDPSTDLTVLVASNVTQTGDVISGTYSDTVTVAPNPGYLGDPGHPGTGTVVGDCLASQGGGT